MEAKKAAKKTAAMKPEKAHVKVDVDGAVTGFGETDKDEGHAQVETQEYARTLTRIELARQLPIIADGVPTKRALMTPGSIEAFRTLDGKTMQVVLARDADGRSILAAQGIQPTEGGAS